MGNPNQQHLSDLAVNRLSGRDAAWLATTMERNRALFGGWRMEAGGTGSGDGSGTGDGAGSGDGAGTDGAGDGSGDGSGKQPPWGDAANFNAEKAWELIQNLRTEKGDPQKVADLEQQLNDLKTAQQSQLDAIAKAAGLKPDDTPPDPAKLAEEITAEQGKTADAETRATAAERALAVFKRALDPQAGLGANPIALLDSTSFLTAIKDVDHTDTAKLDEAIKAAVDANPLLKTTSGTPPFPGGPRPTPATRAGSLGEAIANKIAGQGR